MRQAATFLLLAALCLAHESPGPARGDLAPSGAAAIGVRGEVPATAPGEAAEKVSMSDVLSAVQLLAAEFGGLRSEFGGLRSEFGGLRSEFAGFRSEFAGFRSEFAGFRCEFIARLDAMVASQAKLEAAQVENRESFAEILSSTLTPLSAERVDACAKLSVWHYSYVTSANRSKACSAFLFTRAPGAAAAVVTAGHCVRSLVNPGVSLVLRGVGALPTLSCVVWAQLPAESDAALLNCTGAGGLAGLAPSLSAGRLSQAVAIAGFSRDSYTGLTSRHLPGEAVALNVDFAHVVGVAGPSIDANGELCVSSGADDAEFSGARPAGFVDRRVSPGLSGGPVLDLQCGVLGIAHGRLCGAGAFVGLGPVHDFLAEASKVAEVD